MHLLGMSFNNVLDLYVRKSFILQECAKYGNDAIFPALILFFLSFSFPFNTNSFSATPISVWLWPCIELFKKLTLARTLPDRLLASSILNLVKKPVSVCNFSNCWSTFPHDNHNLRMVQGCIYSETKQENIWMNNLRVQSPSFNEINNLHYLQK